MQTFVFTKRGEELVERVNNHEKNVLFSLSIIQTCPEEEEEEEEEEFIKQ